MNAIISNGDYTARVQLPVERRQLSYPEAIRSLLGNNAGEAVIGEKKQTIIKPKKPFQLPEKHTDMRRVYGYLMHERMIDQQVLNRFVTDGLIYEDAEYHNAVFVGKNGNTFFMRRAKAKVGI